MGLDMYLTRKTYIGAQYEHRNVKGTIDITINGKQIPINFNRVCYVEEDVGYWRKANAIHKWFVDNVQNGVDDCKDYYVPKEKLEELLDICKKVKENHELAKELLPTTNGFFFGSIDYDEYYFEDIENTIKIIEDTFSDYDKLLHEYFYHSSW